MGKEGYWEKEWKKRKGIKEEVGEENLHTFEEMYYGRTKRNGSSASSAPEKTKIWTEKDQRNLEELQSLIKKYDEFIVETNLELEKIKVQIKELLPEDVGNQINNELAFRKNWLETGKNLMDGEMKREIEGEIELQESDPISHYTEIKIRDEDALNSLKKGTDQQSVEERTGKIAYATKKIEQLEKIINALRAVNPEKKAELLKKSQGLQATIEKATKEKQEAKEIMDSLLAKKEKTTEKEKAVSKTPEEAEKAERLKMLLERIEISKRIIAKNKEEEETDEALKEALIKEREELERLQVEPETAISETSPAPEETKKSLWEQIHGEAKRKEPETTTSETPISPEEVNAEIDIERRRQEELENPEVTIEEFILTHPNLTDYGKESVKKEWDNEDGYFNKKIAKGEASLAFKYMQGKISPGDLMSALGWATISDEEAKKYADRGPMLWKAVFDRINAKYDAELANFKK